MNNHPTMSCRRLGTSTLAALALAATSLPAAAQTVVRVGLANVDPNSSASDLRGPTAFPAPGSVPAGVSLSVKSQSTLLLTLSRTLVSNWDAELALGVPPTHDVVAKLDTSNPQLATVAGLQGHVIAKIRQFSPTAFVNYNFGDSSSMLRPFVGLGINYTKFDKTESTADGNALAGGATRISLSDSTGWAAHAGVNWQVDPQWSVSGSWSTADVKTTLTASTAGYDRTADIKFRPRVLAITVGRSF
jgi:outer membrane protein